MSDNDYQPDLDVKAWQHVRAERPTEWQRMQAQREAERLADTDAQSESTRLETLAKLHQALSELERALAEMRALLEEHQS
jgi:hypothetical protein